MEPKSVLSSDFLGLHFLKFILKAGPAILQPQLSRSLTCQSMRKTFILYKKPKATTLKL